jgi:type VI secretion system secreted protein Hcp
MHSLAPIRIGLLFSLAVVAPSRAVAAQDIFLAIPGLDGESTDEQFRGTFDVQSVTSGVASEPGGKPTFSPVVVKLKRTTAASPALEEAVATGRTFPQAVVSFRRPGESSFVFLTYTLTDVAVAAFQRDANATDDAPLETVSLRYGQIKTDYHQQNPDGSPGPTVSVCWDARTNARCK